MTTTDYRPIDCDQHSVLELLAMRRTPVRVEYRGGDGSPCRVEALIVDVLTRKGEEFAVLSVGPDRLSVRLDQLEAIYSGPERVFPVGPRT